MINAFRTALFVTVGPATFCAAPLTAQTVVPVHEEPRHRLVHDGPQLRVLDILIEPGDTTLFHRHDAPMAYVQIDASVVNSQTLGGSWGRVRQPAVAPTPAPGRVSINESYDDEPLSHRVTALGPGRFRLIGVLNRGSAPAGARSGPLGAFAVPDGDSRFFAHARRELPAGDRIDWVANDRPVVMILASEGSLRVSEGGDDPAVPGPALAGPGDFVILAPGRAYSVVNGGDGAVTVTFVEAR